MDAPCHGAADVRATAPCYPSPADRQRGGVPSAAAARHCDLLAVHAVAAAGLRPVLARAELPALAAADLRLPAWRLRPPVLQHAGRVHVRLAAGADLGPAAVPDFLSGVRRRRRPVPAAGGLVDGLRRRSGVSHRGCVRWRVRPAAGLRHAVPEPAGDAAVPADPDEGTHLRDRVRRDLAAAGRHRLAAGRSPLRPPGRHAVRLAGDPLLAWADALRWRPAASAPPQPPAPGEVARPVTKERRGHPRLSFFRRTGFSARPGSARPPAAAWAGRPCSRTRRRTPAGWTVARWRAPGPGLGCRPRAARPRRWPTPAAPTAPPTR